MEKYGLLFESIFKRKLADENAVGYLENITKEHPYFSIAQFYLLQLLQKDLNGYKKQAKKTAVLFNNNHWLNFQLIEAGYNNKVAETIASPAPVETSAGHFDNKIFISEKPVEAFIVDAPVAPVIETIEQEPASIEEEKIAGIENEATIEGTQESSNAAAENEITKIQPIEETATEVFEEGPTQIAAENTAAVEGEIMDTEAEEGKVAGAENEIPAIETTEEKIDVATAPLLEKEEESIVASTETNASIQIKEPVSEAESVIEPVELPIEDEIPARPIAEPVVANEPLLFEPLHTTDYFASVGIKLSEEEKSSGKLGKQLMSFTEWLKTMKKVHTTQLAGTTAAVEVEVAHAETNIQKLAEKSNQENDVVTEAMAEVLLQQGRQGKAIEILEKLSLLNPSKSAYFAAKINQIKEK